MILIWVGLLWRFCSCHIVLMGTLLVYHVLLHLQKRLSLGSFFRLIEEGGPRLALASRLLQVYAREQNRDMLRDFYYSDDRRVESAVLCLEDAANSQDPAAKLASVKAAQKFFSEDKDRSFEAKVHRSHRVVSLPLLTLTLSCR